jgi:hypothetical protein
VIIDVRLDTTTGSMYDMRTSISNVPGEPSGTKKITGMRRWPRVLLRPKEVMEAVFVNALEHDKNSTGID